MLLEASPRQRPHKTPVWIKKDKIKRTTRIKLHVCFFSIQTRNGPSDTSFILSTYDLLQVVDNAGEFDLIYYDRWSFIQYIFVEKRIQKEEEKSKFKRTKTC